MFKILSFTLPAILVVSFLFAQTQQPTHPEIANKAGADAGQLYKTELPGIVSWVHIGDLHITLEKEQNYIDLQRIVEEANRFLAPSINFAFLPGDNADDGSEAEYAIIRKAIDQLRVPLLIVPGDHDVKSGSLDLYTKYLMPAPYQSFTVDRYRLIFLDALDESDGTRRKFGLGADQLSWLSNELRIAATGELQPVVFMHSFPGELEESAKTLLELIHSHHVSLVEVGHTHYNAVSNDGQTIYAATRSTGQVQEGPVGFSVTNLDNGVVSWKFKTVGGDWPFVMITSPADKRFITEPADPNQVIKGKIDLRLKVWSDQPVESATYRIDGGERLPLKLVSDAVWSAVLDSTKIGCGDHRLSVEVKAKGGKTAQDKIIITVNQDGNYIFPERAPGADNNSIGMDLDRGLLGTLPPHGPPPGHGPHAHPAGDQGEEED